MLRFLLWPNCHPLVMGERAAVLEWSEALFREADAKLRRAIVSARQSRQDRRYVDVSVSAAPLPCLTDDGRDCRGEVPGHQVVDA